MYRYLYQYLYLYVHLYLYLYINIYMYIYISEYGAICRLRLDKTFVLKCIIFGGGAGWPRHAGVLVQPRQAPLRGCRRAHSAALHMVGHAGHHCSSGGSTPLPLPQVQANLGNIKIYYFLLLHVTFRTIVHF